MRLLALAVVLTALTISPSFACQTPADVHAYAVEQWPGTAVHLRFSGADASRFVDKLNAIPPVTDHKADEVMIFKNPNFPRAYLVQLFVDGCLTGGGAVAKPMVDAIRASITKISGQRI